MIYLASPTLIRSQIDPLTMSLHWPLQVCYNMRDLQSILRQVRFGEHKGPNLDPPVLTWFASDPSAATL